MIRLILDTQSIPNQQLVDSQSSVERLICIDWKLINWQLSVKQGVDWVASQGMMEHSTMIQVISARVHVQ